MISGIVTAIGGFFSFINAMLRRRDRQDAEKAGALKQRAASDDETIKVQRRQLDTAVNKRPGAARKKFKKGEF